MIVSSSCCDFEDSNLLTVSQALANIQAEVQVMEGFEQVPLHNGLGRLLAQAVVSPINVPAYPNAAMDGYAIHAKDLAAAEVQSFQVIGIALAGQPFDGLVSAGQCVRIMTGAMMPAGADTVVMQEDVTTVGETIRVPMAKIRTGQHVRLAGEDLTIGQVVLKPGKRLLPPELGLLASLGKTEVCVKRRLRVAFFSTGDELCSVGAMPQAGQIYDSNRYTLHGMLTRLGVEVMDLGVVRDQREALRRTLVEAADSADIVISSGGVSVGEADLVKEVLLELGRVEFWKIAMRPGRPLAYGKIKDSLFFGLPGNPVAVMVTFYQLVQPTILTMMGATSSIMGREWKVRCLSSLKKRTGRREFQRGWLEQTSDGEWVVHSTGPQGSGILRSMSEGNCFIVLPEEKGNVAAGEWVMVQPFEEFM